MKFSIHKRCWVPKHLQCEMFSTMTHIDQQLRHWGNKWKDQVVINGVPFLYYLVYRQLGQPSRSWWTMSVGLKEYEAMLRQHSIYLFTAGWRRTSLMKPMLSTNSQFRRTPETISPAGTWPGSCSNTQGKVLEQSPIGSPAT